MCGGGKIARKRPKYLHLDFKAKTGRGQLKES
jgi:hypothetical protein